MPVASEDRNVFGLYGDTRFYQVEPYVHQGLVNNERWSVVEGTMDVMQYTEFALGKGRVERVVAAVTNNVIAKGFIVLAKVDNNNTRTVCYVFDASEVYPRLQYIPLRKTRATGAEFWRLSPALVESGFTVAEKAWI
jgi:beta-glucosidase/6-phospho-beta-glucosidase/beta-galactosidase